MPLAVEPKLLLLSLLRMLGMLCSLPGPPHAVPSLRPLSAGVARPEAAGLPSAAGAAAARRGCSAAGATGAAGARRASATATAAASSASAAAAAAAAAMEARKPSRRGWPAASAGAAGPKAQPGGGGRAAAGCSRRKAAVSAPPSQMRNHVIWVAMKRKPSRGLSWGGTLPTSKSKMSGALRTAPPVSTRTQ